MNIFKLSYRNLTSRPLNTLLSLTLLTLGIGMISFLLQIKSHIEQQIENNVRNIDMVVGAKGSPLQLILSAVYQIDVPTGNISLEEAEQLSKNQLVQSAIPLSYGDSYKGYRIVGTDYQYPQLYGAKVNIGRLWQEPMEVVLGATVAKNLDLRIDAGFIGSHGLVEGGEAHKRHKYRVVGVFDYSNSVLDQLIITPTESVWEVHDHEDTSKQTSQTSEKHKHLEHDTNKEITAMLVQFRNPMGMVQLPRIVNETTNMQAAVPTYEISRLFSLMGVGIDTLSAIAITIMSVSGLSVFISLYGSLKDRQYEMALMRSYGSTRWQLVWLVLQEGLLLALAGLLLGILCSRIGLWLVSRLMEASYHYPFSCWVWLKEEWWLMTTALVIGLLASLLPAIRAFHINISKTLANA